MITMDGIRRRQMETIEKTIEFLAPLSIGEDAIYELYDEMVNSKENINKVFKLNEGNQFRRVINFNMTEEIFKDAYPDTYKYVETLANGLEFSITGNWIKAPRKRKLSRFLGKVVNANGGHPSEINMKLYNEIRNGDLSVIFDIIKPKGIVISTNMYDFFTSASNASFRSCYAIDGSHFNGNIAYMTDRWSFMIYTYSKNIHRKIGRVWGYYLDDPEQPMFLTSKVYGSMYEAEIGMAILTISKMINPDAIWKANEIDYDKYYNARPGMDYPIPVYFDYDAIVLHHTKKTIKFSELPNLHFNNINCMRCGENTIYGYYGMCRGCGENVIRCNICQKIFHYDNLIDNLNICQECYDENYKPCEECNVKYPSENLKNVDGRMLCINCLLLTHRKCSLCNEYHKIENVEQLQNLFFCNTCRGKIYQCNKCGNIMIMINENDEPIKFEGNSYCTGCYNEISGNHPDFTSKEWEFNWSNYYGRIRVTTNDDNQTVSITFNGEECTRNVENITFTKELSIEDISTRFPDFESNINEICEGYMVEKMSYYNANILNTSTDNSIFETLQTIDTFVPNERRRGRFHIPAPEQPEAVNMENDENLSMLRNYCSRDAVFNITANMVFNTTVARDATNPNVELNTTVAGEAGDVTIAEFNTGSFTDNNLYSLE